MPARTLPDAPEASPVIISETPDHIVIANRTVTPLRRPNRELRTREHLTEAEVDALMKAARQNRHGHRDAAMILIAFRHGLRAAETINLRWDQIDFAGSRLHVRRVKKGTPSTHPLSGVELRALRQLRRDAPQKMKRKA